MSTNRNPGISSGTMNVVAGGVSLHNVGLSSGTVASYSSTVNNSGFSGYNGASMGGTIFSNPSVSSSEITIHGSKGEIVKINTDGEVIWANPETGVTEAAQAFGKSLRLGAELSCGITDAVKREMRDIVFQEIIEIAKEDGPLDANQLIYMHRSAKIIDKLRGKF